MKKKIVGILICTLMIGTAILPVVGTINENVVWENGMNYGVPGTSQWDESSGCDWYAADDFFFEEDTKVSGVRWIGDYHDSGYQEANFDWAFQFYLDRGDSNAPGDEFTGPFIFPHEMCNPVFIEDNGNEKYYEYSVELPNTLQFSGDEKYWISIWSIGEFPTKAGPAWHYNPIKLHQCVGKSEYFNHPDW